jgi:UDP-2,3-diacylglucosamine pyrophosphatase LpxH
MLPAAILPTFWRVVMAKKARKKSVAKAKKAKGAKAKGAKAKTKTKVKTKAKSKTSVRKKPARKAQPKGISGRVAGAYHTVVDTIKETGALRDKMEPPGTSETE